MASENGSREYTLARDRPLQVLNAGWRLRMVHLAGFECICVDCFSAQRRMASENGSPAQRPLAKYPEDVLNAGWRLRMVHCGRNDSQLYGCKCSTPDGV